MIHGKLTCPGCGQHLELSATKAPTQQAQPQSPTATPSSGKIGQLLAAIDDDALTGKNREFVTQTRERYEQYAERTRMSDKQMSWLESLASGEAEAW